MANPVLTRCLPAYQAAPFVSNVLHLDEATGPFDSQAEKASNGDGILDDLPASYRVDKVDLHIARPESQFFRQELDMERLHRIMHWLWLCGQTVPPRPLHHQLLMDRRIVVTERLDFHLVWGNNRIFLKPLPRWLIHRDFWERHMLEEPAPISSSAAAATPGSIRTLRSSALGFLWSYLALIQHESDFHVAQDARLIPGELTWKRWKLLVREVLQSRSGSELGPRVADRFIYGELRLHRLNLIYQCLGFSVKGYVPRWSSYKAFIQDNLDVVVAGTLYLGLVLTAMQVGLSTTALGADASFQSASYGATVLAILGPLAAVGLVLLCATVDFLKNWAWNRRNEKKTEEMLGRSWR